MARFMITTKIPAFVASGLNEPIATSCRESRAKRHARKLRADGFKSVMLFKNVNGAWMPVGFKQSTRLPLPCNGSHELNCSSPFIDLHPDPKVQKVQSVVTRLNRLARQAANG